MPKYKYTVVSGNGEKVSGIIEGFNEMDAAAKLKENYPIVQSLSEVGGKGGKGSGFMAMEIGGNKVNDKAFTLMCSQFAVILKAGIPISRTVELICQRMSDKTLKRILEHVAEDVESGRTLSASFTERGGKIFPLTFIETIHAGEEAGDLATAFQSISEHFNKQMKLKGSLGIGSVKYANASRGHRKRSPSRQDSNIAFRLTMCRKMALLS